MSHCADHWDRPCPPHSCALGRAQEDAQALIVTEAALEGDVQYWALIELPDGKVVKRTSHRVADVNEWKNHPRNTLLEFGTGPAPWESPGAAAQPARQDGGGDLVRHVLPAQPAAPAPTATASQPATAGAVPGAAATCGTRLSSQDTVEAFEAATTPAAAPAPAIPEKDSGSAPSAGPDPTDPVVIDLVLEHLATIADVRIRNESRRLQAVLAELRENNWTAKHPKYRIASKPFDASPF